MAKANPAQSQEVPQDTPTVDTPAVPQDTPTDQPKVVNGVRITELPGGTIREDY